MFLSNLSIKRPVFASVMMLALVTLGLFSWRRLPIDMMPDVEIPVLSIISEFPGASPETVEREVTKRIEEAVNPISGIKHVMSVSREGLSSVVAEFNLEVKINDVSQEARAKINGIRGELPEAMKEPVIQKFDIAGTPIISLAVRSTALGPRDLTTLADRKIKRRLESVPGVAKAKLVGAAMREVAVELDPSRLQALGMGVDEVMAGLQSENVNTPLGRLNRGPSEMTLRISGKPRQVEEYAGMVIARRGTQPITLGEVAEVVDTVEEERSLALVNGEPAVAIDITKQTKANTVAVVDGVRKVVEELQAEMPEGTEVQVVRDSSVFIRDAVDDVKMTLVLGAILTVFIVFCFLNSWRSTVITGLTLPISVIASFIVMYFLNMTLNMLTLMALSLAIGMLIDDAIVVRENIVRHMEHGEDHYTAAGAGTSEIGFAVLATTMSVLAVFIPVGFMGGIVGKFFFQFGITVAFAIAVSLFVSFTLDPMLSSIWYDPQAAGHAERGPVGKTLERFNARFRDLGVWYRGVIAWALDHRKTTVGIAVGAFVLAIGLLGVGAVGGEFMPKSDRSEISVTVQTPVGSSLAYTRAKADEVDRYVRSLPEVAFTYLTIGGGQQSTVTDGTIYVRLKPQAERSKSQEAMMVELRRVFPSFRGVTAFVNEAGGMGGGQRPIQVNILGPDIARLQEISDRALAAIRDVPGLVELKSSLEGRKPEFVVELDRDLAASLGVTVGSVSTGLRTVLSGTTASNFEDASGLTHDVVVRLAPEFRESSTDLSRIPLATTQVDTRTMSLVMVPLGQVARILPSGAPSEVKRYQLERMARIEGNYQGRSLTQVSGDIQRRLQRPGLLPTGYSIAVGGQQEMFVETVGFIIESLVLAIVFVYLILASQFGSFLQPLAIMLALPLSLIGVMLGLILTRGTFNMMSMIGVIMLMGLVTKNAILLVDFTNKARAAGSSRREALIDAGQIRLRPILMTTLAMIFGMLPTALALGEGGEFRAPMARAVIGGLITSTLLTLIVVPVVHTFFDDFGGRVVGWLTTKEKAGEALPAD